MTPFSSAKVWVSTSVLPKNMFSMPKVQTNFSGGYDLAVLADEDVDPWPSGSCEIDAPFAAGADIEGGDLRCSGRRCPTSG